MPEKGPWIQMGRVATRPDQPVLAGRSAVADRPRRPPPEPEPIDIAVLYEDEWLIAVNKPAGMVVHPTYRNWSGTLLNALLWRLRVSPGPKGPGLHVGEGPGLRDIEPRIVTRLDKDTSGIVLVALTSEIHARVQRDTAARRVNKEYLAIVRGAPTPTRGSIVLPLARSAEDRRRVIVTPTGQHCETGYEVIGRPEGRPLHEDLSLVRCELVTGRMHQIRVHLAARGWPILGDRVYGEAHAALARQALHAWRVTLPHPISRELLEVEAPVPADLRAFTQLPIPNTPTPKKLGVGGCGVGSEMASRPIGARRRG